MAKFHIHKNNKEEYYWYLQAKNGNKICWSEWYTTKQSAKESIEFTKLNAKDSPIEDHTL